MTSARRRVTMLLASIAAAFAMAFGGAGLASAHTTHHPPPPPAPSVTQVAGATGGNGGHGGNWNTAVAVNALNGNQVLPYKSSTDGGTAYASAGNGGNGGNAAATNVIK